MGSKKSNSKGIRKTWEKQEKQDGGKKKKGEFPRDILDLQEKWY